VLDAIAAQPLGITLVANRAARHGFLRFGADRNIGKTNKYADKHQEEFDLRHCFASAIISGNTVKAKSVPPIKKPLLEA
jgi:hypothetical protein